MNRFVPTAEMASQTPSPLRAGTVLEIRFPTFTPRIAIHFDRELTVEIVAGDNSGFLRPIEYEAVEARDGPVVLSWQQHIGSTIVHVLDLNASETYAAVTPANMRLMGRILLRAAYDY